MAALIACIGPGGTRLLLRKGARCSVASGSEEWLVAIDELMQALVRPAAYPHRPRHVHIVQTHASVIFFADDSAYKVKKPVDLGFLDFSTLERRRHFCEEEVRLNRRLAHDVYLGVVPITRDDEGAMRIGGDGNAVEYAVEMVRLPSERMLDHLLAAGNAGDDEIDAITRILADFHAAAATGEGVNVYGSPRAVADHLRRNLRDLRTFACDVPETTAPDGPVLSMRLWKHLRAWIERRLSAGDQLLARRVEQGRIRDGHGDLHAGNICMLQEQGRLRPVIYDCIEFNPAFRCSDVAADVAFLGMDLDMRNRRDLSGRLAALYAQLAGDHELHLLQPFYRCHFALVRAKVNAIRARDADVPETERQEAYLAAARYAHLAAGYTLPACLVVMTGLPGSGKSWAAQKIAAPLGAAVLRADEIRKELAGLSPAQRVTGKDRDRLYAQRMTDRTYDELLRRGRSALLAGYPVILDGTYPTALRRSAAAGVAGALDVPWAVVHTTAPMPVIRQRMAARAKDLQEVSDADFMVYLKSRGSFAPPEEVPAQRVVEFGANGAAELMVGRVIDALIGG